MTRDEMTKYAQTVLLNTLGRDQWGALAWLQDQEIPENDTQKKKLLRAISLEGERGGIFKTYNKGEWK
jgi:hypothetical protein